MRTTAPPRTVKQFRRNISHDAPLNYRNRLMSEFPAEGGENGDMQTVMENFQKKNNLVTGRTHHVTHHPQVTTTSSQMLTTNQSQHQSSSSTSSSSSSSSTSSRVAKSSQRILTSSSSSEMKASSMKSDLTELKRGISEMKNISTNFSQRLRSSMENLVDRDSSGPEEADLTEPLVTFPDPDTPPPVSDAVTLTGNSPSQLSSLNSLNNLHHSISPPINISNMANLPAGQETMKFEQKKMTSASKTKVVTDGFSAEKATANSAEMRALQAGDVSYKEQSAATAARARVELDGVSAEKSIAAAREQRSLKAGDLSHQESNNMAASTMKLQSDSFTSEKKAMAAQQQRQTVTSTGIFNHEKHMASSSQSSITIASKSGVSASKSSMINAASAVNQLMNGMRPPTAEDELLSLPLDDLDLLCSKSNPQDVDCAIAKYCNLLDSFVERLKASADGGKINSSSSKAPQLLNRVNEIIRKAWAVPTHGHELGYTLCNTLRTRGGLDLLMSNCVANDHELQFSSARLLEQCLTTENRAHVVENGLEKVVNVACVCTKNANSVDHARVGTGILEHLFKHSEGTCSDVIRLGGLDAVLFECRKNDVETLRHCAGALANLSLYGGAENQEAMIKRKVPMWLFPLAFHNDDNIKYYACLAIAVLVANKEIEAAVLKSGTLDLVEPFVTSHNPYEFAKSNLAHAHGQSKNWLERLVPVLSSKREEARNLAAFHFCMEAGIKKQQGNTDIFRTIGAIEPLKKVASCPNAIASKYAAQALRLIGEEIPHKLSQQVPLWSTEDVREWVKQIGFAEVAPNFVESRVDGDLLLQLTEENLREDIGLTNGIMRRRFARELQNLKKMADYSSRDTGNLNNFLQSIGQEFSIYTYSMLNAGVDKDSIRNLSEDQLLTECGITNSIHRLRILDAIKNMQHNQFSSCEYESPDKSLDVFVSYRRSNGSQLASLLKVHLQLRGFSVFIDVERLEAGKFDNNLLQSIRQAKHFLLVLTPQALERCIQDSECKDWVHREIVAALQSQCNIIPIIDNFQWPEPEELPEDMRAVCHFNGVRWIHDYQDACVDKLERFMRGEIPMRSDLSGGIPRSMAPKDVAQPNTPSNTNIRQPPSYQRMHSNESRGSDKDSTGGRD
ncbi:sterile alpha and TIR motif-containing protein 1 isoform X2 [Pogonomyrmex barbatus]|uniref:ADP-ribosyl cyclase/cyclic ADP-ribose hydrolase n=1 Tax=Pogonomyrmex barbatus TaxID=144034 RepID=A0A8N1SCN1_9HYME|nr:sterile alpha and TIR motif-containing protein 1 isoform X2 [Pogonomyrmex barbatus]